MNKKVEKRQKKVFDQLLGAHSTQKLVEIHNNQHPKQRLCSKYKDTAKPDWWEEFSRYVKRMNQSLYHLRLGVKVKRLKPKLISRICKNFFHFTHYLDFTQEKLQQGKLSSGQIRLNPKTTSLPISPKTTSFCSTLWIGSGNGTDMSFMHGPREE